MLFINGNSSISSLAHKLELHVKGRLWAQVLIGMFLGLTTGILLGPDMALVAPEKTTIITNWIALPGEIFLRLIRMILVPLVLFSVIRGLGGSNIKELRRIGPKFLIYLLSTSAFACTVGIALASLMQPGSYVQMPAIPEKLVETGDTGVMATLPGTMVNLIPENPLASAMNGEMLSIVIFALLFGIALAMQNNRNIQHILDILDGLLAVFMTIVKWAMLLTPLAVFGLIARMAAQTGFSVLLGMGVFIGAVFTGLVTVLLMYYAVILIFMRENPLRFASKITGVQLLAFSTSSSAAVMPMTIRTAEEELNAEASVSQIIVPLGTTMNMSGSSVYQSISIIFMAQSAGIELDLSKMILISLTVIASSIGSPGTPGVGLGVLSAVATSLGIPVGGAYGLILGVDRILDMCRTVVNVTGDLVACVLFGTKK